MPLAVSGRWRATTMPATSTVGAVLDPRSARLLRRIERVEAAGAAAPAGACRAPSRSSGSRRSACPTRRAAPARGGCGRLQRQRQLGRRRRSPRPAATTPTRQSASRRSLLGPDRDPVQRPRPGQPFEARQPGPRARGEVGDRRRRSRRARARRPAPPSPPPAPPSRSRARSAPPARRAAPGRCSGDSTWQRTRLRLASGGAMRMPRRCASWTSESGG